MIAAVPMRRVWLSAIAGVVLSVLGGVCSVFVQCAVPSGDLLRYFATTASVDCTPEQLAQLLQNTQAQNLGLLYDPSQHCSVQGGTSTGPSPVRATRFGYSIITDIREPHATSGLLELRTNYNPNFELLVRRTQLPPVWDAIWFPHLAPNVAHVSTALLQNGWEINGTMAPDVFIADRRIGLYLICFIIATCAFPPTLALALPIRH